jgi:phytoene synthase
LIFRERPVRLPRDTPDLKVGPTLTDVHVARDTNFYYSFLVLPAEKRRAIVAVWDFCRAVDDATDEIGREAPEVAAAELGKWRRELAACFDGLEPQTPQGRALLPFVQRFHLPRSAFEALIEGVEMDVVPRRYQTFGELYEYCIRVASAVGLICLEIFGYRDPAARQYARDLGVALQLTNILRDVPGDFERGRVYIPQEDFAAHGCTEADLKQEIVHRGGGIKNAAIEQLLRHQAARAREYYGRAAQHLPRGDARRLVAAEIMGAIYRRILDRIEQRRYDVFSEVVRIPRPQRALIAAATWGRTVFRP